MATYIVSKNTTGTYANTGYTGVNDTRMNGLAPTTNYASNTILTTNCWDSSADDVGNSVIKFDVSSVGAGTVTNAEIGFYLNGGNNDFRGVSIFQLLVSFVDTQVTFNVRQTSTNWNTANARGSGTDRGSTALLTTTRSATSGAWMTFSGAALNALIEDYLDGTTTNHGFVIELTDYADDLFTYQDYVSSEGTDGNRPYLKFDHTSSGVTASLTGQSITSAQGNVTDNISYALTGQATTSAQGDVADAVSYGLTGQPVAIQQGNITDTVAYSITGQSFALSQGNLADAVSVGLTGQQVTTQQGDVASNGDVTRALSGQSITAQQGSLSIPQENLFGGVAHFAKLSERSRKLRELEAQERIQAPTSEDIAEVVQIPQEVKEVISNVAKIDNDKKQRAQLKAQLKALEIQFKQEYADALKTEMIRQYLIIEQERQEEEEAIAMMMMALV